mmetsp:Transcript_8202/g.23538  ORF Transcript_8202/g.23538 Transcript_8202/m.23538 type:complete len:133 (-) Transcript_8202:185-583(-)
MSDTMAISYRWQSKIAEVAFNLHVNMNDWQMEQVVLGIERTKCLYVWIDVGSVPQHDKGLKKILLSRMMAVYRSAFVTLALLSRESEMNRYHQRMWALQELCASKQLLVARQDEEPEGDEEDPSSLDCLHTV